VTFCVAPLLPLIDVGTSVERVPPYSIRLVNWFMSKYSRQALILPSLTSKAPMTGSSNDLSESLKTSTRSINTTGPLAAMLMTRNSMPSMPGGPGRMNDAMVFCDVLPAGDRRQRDVVIDGVVGEELSQFCSSDVVGPRRAEPAHHLDRALHLVPPHDGVPA